MFGYRRDSRVGEALDDPGLEVTLVLLSEEHGRGLCHCWSAMVSGTAYVRQGR